MKKRILIALVVVLALATTGSLVWAATPPVGVVFEVPTTIPGGGLPTFGPFTATGPAVDDLIVCASGDTRDVFGKTSGFQSQTGGVNIQVVKRFTCGDGSGEFFVKLQVRIDKKGDNFNWNILGGTEDYEKLHGTGKGIGLPLPEDVLDLYSGKVHVD